MKYFSTIAAALALALFIPSSSFGQEQGRRPSPEEFRKMRDERIKAALKANDEEWTVLQPMISKVEEKAGALFAFRTSSRSFGGDTSGGGRPPGGGGFGGRGGGTPSPEVTALVDAAQRDGVSNEEYKAKIEAARAARKRAQAELDSARAELQKVVTVRQEAILLAMGLLD